MDCAIYVRVSSEGQVLHGHSLDAQVKAGIERCNREKWSYQIFREEGKSASKENLDNRPELLRIMDLADDKKIKYVFVTELDRLSRNEMVLYNIKKTFRENNILVITTGHSYDFRDENNELFAMIESAFAVHENRRRVKRFKRAILESMLKGNWSLGSSCMPFGYDKVQKKLVICEEEKKIYLQIVDWFLDGKTPHTIANLLNSMGIKTKKSKIWKRSFLWCDRSVREILSNDFYKGEFNFKGEHIIKVPQIIDAGKWQRIQDTLRARKRNSTRNNKKQFYLLRGLLVCKKCGRRLQGIICATKRTRVYGCNSRRSKHTHCGLKSINLDRLNNFVWDEMKAIATDIAKLQSKILEHQNHLLVDSVEFETQNSQIEKSIKQKEQELKDILRRRGKYQDIPENLIQEVIAEVNKERESLLSEKGKFEDKIAQINSSKAQMHGVTEYLLSVSENIDEFDQEERRQFLNLLISHIEVGYDESKREHIVDIHCSISKEAYTHRNTVEIQEASFFDPNANSCRSTTSI